MTGATARTRFRGIQTARSGRPVWRRRSAVAERIVSVAPDSRYRRSATPSRAASRCPAAQSSTSTMENDVSTNSAVRARAAYSSSFADPVVRPGPWTDEGLTVTTSIPRSLPTARASRSPRYFDRSYRERNHPR